MNIINENENIFILENQKLVLLKYFEKSHANILKINTLPDFENFFLVYNENIKEKILLLKFDISKSKNNFLDYEISEIDINLDQSFPNENSETKNLHKILGVYLHLNRLYIVNSFLSVFIIDMKNEQKSFYKLKLEEEDLEENYELCDFSAFGIVNPKIIFSGGINKNKKISNELFSFDISTYKFELNKVRENNFIGRYRHGMYSDNSYIYVIGGFMKIINNEEIEKINEENSSEFICEKIQLIKFDTLMESYMELKYEGKAPKLIVDPYLQLFNRRYLFAFSKFLYEKIWYLDIKSNYSNEINLNFLEIPKNLINFNGFYFNEKDQKFIACYPVFENNKKVSPQENPKQQSEVLKENDFNFIAKILSIKEEN